MQLDEARRREEHASAQGYPLSEATLTIVSFDES